MPHSQSLSSSNAVAVCANHFAFDDFTFCLRNALGVADVQRLAAVNVVKFECDRVGFVPTVGTTSIQLVGIQPIANTCRAVIRLLVDHLTIAGSGQSLLPPRLHLLRSELAFWARSFPALIRTEFSRALGEKAGAAMDASKFSTGDFFPRRHPMTVPSVAFPCKPDIFAATYELVSEACHD